MGKVKCYVARRGDRGTGMDTVYDWVTLALFCGLATLFLDRSVGPEAAGDRGWHYLPPALLCALANYLGNQGTHLAAALLLVAIGAYAWLVLKPGRRPRG